MEEVELATSGGQEILPDALPFARSYQMEALAKAIKQNTIVYLETGSGKTLIAIMLLRSYAYHLRKPSPYIGVFLVPTVVLVTQQAEAVAMHTDLKVGKHWGDIGVDYWDDRIWKQQLDNYEVFVMTPTILLNALRHRFLRLDMIKVLIFDECHNARGRHPYACIMTEFYHRQLQYNNSKLPRIFGMTASPVKAKGSSWASTYRNQILELENLMNSKVYTTVDENVLAEYIPFSTPKLKFYDSWDIPYALFECLSNDLKNLKEKHESALRESNMEKSAADSARGRLSKLVSTFLFCLTELGVWLALKATESLSCYGTHICLLEKLDVHGQGWSIGDDLNADKVAGYLSSKVVSLIESLLDYRYPVACALGVIQRILDSRVLAE